jgi:hypothetical protein
LDFCCRGGNVVGLLVVGCGISDGLEDVSGSICDMTGRFVNSGSAQPKEDDFKKS